MTVDDGTVRVLSRISAVVSFLGGVAIIGVMAMLVTLFSSRSLLDELAIMMRDPIFDLFVAVGLVAMACAPFIWRQHLWAMLVAFTIAGTLLFFFGNETELLRWLLTGSSTLLGVCSGMRLWLGRSTAGAAASQ